MSFVSSSHPPYFSCPNRPVTTCHARRRCYPTFLHFFSPLLLHSSSVVPLVAKSSYPMRVAAIAQLCLRARRLSPLPFHCHQGSPSPSLHYLRASASAAPPVCRCRLAPSPAAPALAGLFRSINSITLTLNAISCFNRGLRVWFVSAKFEGQPFTNTKVSLLKEFSQPFTALSIVLFCPIGLIGYLMKVRFQNIRDFLI